MISVRMFTVLATVVALVLGLAAGCATEVPPTSAPTPTPTPKPVVEPEIEEEPTPTPTPTPTPPPAPASIGDFVWHDTDQDGIQDDPEPGVPEVAVELYVSDDTLAASTTTDEDGSYLFTNVAPGDYYVQFLLPDGYVFTQQDQGDDDRVDSDADTTTGKTMLITLAAGETELTWDAGMYEFVPGPTPTPTPTPTPSPTPPPPPPPVTAVELHNNCEEHPSHHVTEYYSCPDQKPCDNNLLAEGEEVAPGQSRTFPVQPGEQCLTACNDGNCWDTWVNHCFKLAEGETAKDTLCSQ